ncbi:MAG: OB-fold domain-containing protein [Acidimicrobiales bacterium]
MAPLDEDPDGEGLVATYTVVSADGNPARVCAIVDLDSGDRAVAAVDDPEVAVDATVHELIGQRVRVTGRTLADLTSGDPELGDAVQHSFAFVVDRRRRRGLCAPPSHREG